MAPILALVLLFGAPIVAAWSLFLHPEWLPDRHSNRGLLVDPVVPLGQLAFRQWDGTELPVASLRGRWVLLLTAPECEEHCRDSLWNMRQVRLALGSGRERVERLLLLSAPPSAEFLQMIVDEFPGLHVAATTPELEQQLTLADTRPHAIALIDPRGNLMMRYPPAAAGKDLLKDLERLLKVSEYWGDYANR